MSDQPNNNDISQEDLTDLVLNQSRQIAALREQIAQIQGNGAQPEPQQPAPPTENRGKLLYDRAIGRNTSDAFSPDLHRAKGGGAWISGK